MVFEGKFAQFVVASLRKVPDISATNSADE